MPQRHLDVNTPKTISRLTGVGTSQDLSTRRTVASSCQTANTSLERPPPLYMY